jgi:DNA-3-methyladenine glycosylase II
MWFDLKANVPDWSEAQRHLTRVDPVMGAIVKRVGPCMLYPRRDWFVVMCQSIFNQQISLAAAAKLFGRFRDGFPRRRPTPARVLEALGDDLHGVQQCGLSRQKKAYLIDLSRGFLDGRIPVRRFGKMSDEAIIESLTEIQGIGRWTAEMFLMFVLNRADVLPVDDLGLQEKMRIAYGMRSRPTRERMRKIAEAWRPWRTVGSWYLWRSRE